MAVFKASWFFQDNLYISGWTENYFLDAAGYNDAASVMATALPLRIALMMDTTFITTLRISNVDPPRDSLIIAIAPADGQGTYVTATKPSAGMSEALLIRRDTLDRNRFNKQFLHSVPREAFAGRVFLGSTAPAPWPANYAAWIAFMVAGANGFKVRHKVGGVYTYEDQTLYFGERLTTHRIGRPFGLLVGRRRIA